MKFGLIHRLFTGSPQVIHSLSECMGDVAVALSRIRTLETKLKDLEASLDATDAALHKLRGQVHGPKGGRPRLVGVDSVPPGDKEGLRAYAGLKPGTKFTHSEE